MNTKENKQPEALLPDNKMCLLDGRVIDIYPRKEMLNGIDNTLKLDTTGEYLSFYNNKKERPAPYNAASVADRQFFLDNVFFFMDHAEEILYDSRMFLAPVPVQNAIAYSGTNGFKHPTLGVYLEWWMNNRQTIVKDEEGKPLVYWFISGSPLSGMNVCEVVDEKGVRSKRPVRNFPSYWRTFRATNIRYDDCKVFGEAYTLQQVKDLLRKKDTNGEL